MTDAFELDDFFLECARRARKIDIEAVPPKPFIKWAGGKGQLLEDIEPILPPRIRTYYEPFLGGGALFWHLAAEGRFARAVLNDWNTELVDAYRAVRDFPDDLIEFLAGLQKQYHDEDPKQLFDAMRKADPRKGMSPIMRAARFMFLNRTGFNGMYRVNKRGQFNVPWGKYKNPTICNEPLIRACSAVLNDYLILQTGDFAAAVEDAGPGDVVYFDPPYVPLDATSNFTSYTSDGFDINDQHRLAALFRQLAENGVKVLTSNSDTPIVRELYKGFEVNVVQARRNINSKGDKRGPINELLIVGRPERPVLKDPKALATGPESGQ